MGSAGTGVAAGETGLITEMLERLLRNAQKYDADISHCGFQEIHPDGHVVQLHGTGVIRLQDRETALRDLLEERIVEPSLCTKLFRKELFLNLEQKMDRQLKNNEDMLMNFFLFEQAKRAVFEDICPYHYLIHPGSASRRQLTDYLIYDPIRVREIILDNCPAELEHDARRALVRMCLVSYRLLAMETDPKFDRDRKKVREIIARQKQHLSVLPKRNALLVRLITSAPWVFDVLYPGFERLFRK